MAQFGNVELPAWVTDRLGVLLGLVLGESFIGNRTIHCVEQRTNAKLLRHTNELREMRNESRIFELVKVDGQRLGLLRAVTGLGTGYLVTSKVGTAYSRPIFLYELRDGGFTRSMPRNGITAALYAKLVELCKKWEIPIPTVEVFECEREEAAVEVTA